MCMTARFYVALNMLPDMWQGFMQGVVKALGIQKKVFWLSITAYYILNLPLVYLLTFHLQHGFKGLWEAMTISSLFMGVCMHILGQTTDWDKAAEQSQSR